MKCRNDPVAVFVAEFAGIGAGLSPATPYDQAAHTCTEVWQSAFKSGDLATAARAVRGEAECSRRLGRVADAFTGFTAAAQLFQALNDRVEYGWTLWFRSNLKRQIGDPAGALSDLDRAWAIAQAANVPGLAAYLTAGKAETTRILGHYSVSARQHARAGRLFEALGDIRGVVWALQGIAQIQKNQGHLRRAYQLFETSRYLAFHIGDNRGLGWALRGIGETLLRAGRDERASAVLQASLHHFQLGRCLVGAAYTFRSLGDLMTKARHLEQATPCYAQAADLFIAAGDPRGLAFVNDSLSRHHRLAGRRDLAVESSRTALQWFWGHGIRVGVLQASTVLRAFGYSPYHELDRESIEAGSAPAPMPSHELAHSNVRLPASEVAVLVSSTPSLKVPIFDEGGLPGQSLWGLQTVG